MAISCAARDHHRPGLDAFAAVQIEDERPVRARAIERPDADRDHHVSAEFLRLNEGAGGQGLAGDSGRKPEIVLDPGAGSGLAAESAGVENRDRQALGGPIDGRRQAGGPGADHRDVIDEVRSRRGGHADLARRAPAPTGCRAPSRRGKRPAASRRRYRHNGGSARSLRGRSPDRADVADSRSWIRKPSSRITSAEAGGPIRMVPAAPSRRAIRRRMSARMMRSPRSASATRSERSPSVGINRVSTSPSAVASTSAARLESCPTSARK